jgi:hypothetical protein
MGSPNGLIDTTQTPPSLSFYNTFNNFRSVRLCKSIVLNASNCFCADKKKKLKIFTVFKLMDRLPP